ncbi:MAG: hypothetical protein RBS48_10885 [Ignavibacteriaceae bacterium]|jgi:hypothetical protein|nr:hypothetical protein [Ignavibacteriaceae bacterium]
MVNIMGQSKIKENWELIRNRLKENFKNLSEEELEYTDDEEELFNNIQKKLKVSREELLYLFYLYIYG